MNVLFCMLFYFISCFGFLFSDAFPIDVVYTWVNGQDEEWQEVRNEWLHKENPDAPLASGAVANKRFRDREELRYSLRAIRAFMPYVNHIYIVTCGQRPSWMRSHSQITFVDHKDIFENVQNLPTFNSMSIEANLHHIPGLSEHYVYFNDDVFVTEMTTPNTFFTDDGKLRVFLSRHEMSRGTVSQGDNGYEAASKNTANLLNDFYGKKKRILHAHTPFPSIKSVVFRAEAMFPDVFSLVSSHRFRSRHGFTITNGLVPYMALYAGMAEESLFSSVTWMYGSSSDKDKRIFDEVRDHPPQFLCIQDSLKDDSKIAKTDKQLRKYLSALFPERAPWERGE